MINEKTLYTWMRRNNRIAFANKNELESYHLEKMKQFFQHTLSKSPYYKKNLAKNQSENELPTMNDQRYRDVFSQLTNAHIELAPLVEETKAIYQQYGRWPEGTPYHIYYDNDGDIANPYIRPLNTEELISKISAYLNIFGRQAGSLEISVAHLHHDHHLLHHLPKLNKSNYKFYSLQQLPYEELKQKLTKQDPDILIAPQGALLQLARDKQEISINPGLIYLENGFMSARDKQQLTNTFGQIHELHSHHAELLIAPSIKGRLQLMEKNYFFEYKPIDEKRISLFYSDFNSQMIPIFRYQSDGIYLLDEQDEDTPFLKIKRCEMRKQNIFWLPGEKNSYEAIFATPLEEFAERNLPEHSEYLIQQKNIREIELHSNDPLLLKKKETEFLDLLHQQKINTRTLKLSYHFLEEKPLYQQKIERIKRVPFTLPANCTTL